MYSNGTRIILSDKKSSKYIKMDKVYFGLSETDDIIEICECDMSVSELEHLKKELELQWVKRSASKEEAFYLMLYHFSMPIR